MCPFELSRMISRIWLFLCVGLLCTTPSLSRATIVVEMQTLKNNRQVQNVTITHERLGTRWDDAGGDAIDRAIASDDGPGQLKDAMLVLMTVAGSVIFGGAAAVACCWQNRERGFLRGSSKYKPVEGQADPYKGQGAKWLDTPV
mmetsp:Transcript_6041/g.12240  ORF Transcript_6041/g.12240 Transcript_6041/m.12240 type:complete len:144 (-) Transcript_6041:424-855(-)